MIVTVTVDHVKAAIKEYGETSILNKNAPTCCPLHQAMRPYIYHSFDVGSGTIGVRYHSHTHPEVVNRYLTFSPVLPPELYLQPQWEQALHMMEIGCIYKFTVEDIYEVQPQT